MIRKSLLRSSAICILVLLTLGIIESQIVGYAISEARARLSVPEGPTPQEILSSAVAPDGSTTLLAAGDIANCLERPGFAKELPITAYLLGLPSSYDPTNAIALETAALALDWPYAPILALGDTVYSSGRPVEYIDCFEPTWGTLASRILPTPGNHEYNTPGAFGYFDYFGAQAGPARRGWYAARVPGWLILSLNSEVDASPGSAQAEWLGEQLDQAGGDCILGFFHRPAHSLAERDDRDNAVSLFRRLHEGGATLVLNGHNHFYERTVPLDGAGDPTGNEGTIAFTVGTGGRTTGDRPMINTTAAAIFERTGLLRLQLRAGAFNWAYVDALTQEVLDEGTAECNAD